MPTSGGHTLNEMNALDEMNGRSGQEDLSVGGHGIDCVGDIEDAVTI